MLLLLTHQAAVDDGSAAAIRLALHQVLGDMLVVEKIEVMYDCFANHPRYSIASLEIAVEDGISYFETIRNGVVQRLPLQETGRGVLGTPPAEDLRTPQLMLGTHAGVRAHAVDLLSGELEQASRVCEEIADAFKEDCDTAQVAESRAVADEQQREQKEAALHVLVQEIKRKNPAASSKSSKKARLSAAGCSHSHAQGPS